MESENIYTQVNLCWLQPELLCETELIKILQLRCVKIQNLTSKSKDELLEIFQQVVPLPQRKYRQSRKGKLLSKMREKHERSMQNEQGNNSNFSYGFSDEAIPSGSHSERNRLKPPPDIINSKRKTIRLNQNSAMSEELNNIKIKKHKTTMMETANILSKVVIEDRVNNKNCLTNKCDPLDDMLSISMKETIPKKIKLKRSHSQSKLEVPHTTTETNFNKKQKNKIMWP